MKLIRESKQVVIDLINAIQEVISSPPLDPKRFATKPAPWWHKKQERPVYTPPAPPKPKSNARSFWGSEILAEVLEMNDREWAAKYSRYSVMRWSDKYKSLQNQVFDNRNQMIDWLQQEMELDTIENNNQVDLSEDMVTDLTEREYGELRAYKRQRLDDYGLASKIKLLKEKGFKLPEIAEKTKTDYQLVRHYSSALKKAKN